VYALYTPDSPDIDVRKPLRAVTPFYPDAAKEAGGELWTQVSASLDGSGNVSDVRAWHWNNKPVTVIQATLDSLSVVALRGWKFEPWRASFRQFQKHTQVKFIFKQLKTSPEQEGRLFGRLIDSKTGKYALSPNAGLGDPNDPPYGLYFIHEDSFEFVDVSAGTYRLTATGFGTPTSSVDTLVTIEPGRSDTVCFAVKGLRVIKSMY